MARPERTDPSHSTDPTVQGEHYFSSRTTARSDRSSVRLDLPDVSVDLVTDRGVFSPERIDPGTKLLLLELPDLPAGPVLDLGCGYGPIATAVTLRRPGQPLWAVDTNERALALCTENLASNAPTGTRYSVSKPEDVPETLRFAAIVSNPPIRVGKKVLHGMLDSWLRRLEPWGEAWLVVHRHLGADSLADWLRSQGFEVVRVRSRRGYRLLRVTAPGGDPES